MEEEIERIETLLVLHYFIHERIYKITHMGVVKKDEAMKVIWRNHNIPKEESKIILKGMKILGLIRKNKDITIEELAKELNLTTRAVDKNISKLKKQGRIKRVGPDKGGHWEVLK